MIDKHKLAEDLFKQLVLMNWNMVGTKEQNEKLAKAAFDLAEALVQEQERRRKPEESW